MTTRYQKRKKCQRSPDCVKDNKHCGNCKIPSTAVTTEDGTSVLAQGFEKVLNETAADIHEYLATAQEEGSLDLNEVVQEYEDTKLNVKYSCANIERRETKLGTDIDVDKNEFAAVGFELEPILKLIKAQLDKSEIHTSEYGRAIRDSLCQTLGLVADHWDDVYVEEAMSVLKAQAVQNTKSELKGVSESLKALPANSNQNAIKTAIEDLTRKKEALEETLEKYTGKKTVSRVAPKFRLKKHTPLQRQLSKGDPTDFFKLS
eukprot:g7754.t1